MTGKRSVHVAAIDGMACELCGAMTEEISWSAEHAGRTCLECFVAAAPPATDELASAPRSASLTSERAVPSTSPLNPCIKTAPTDNADAAIPLDSGRETEVDQLLRLAAAGEIEPVVVELPALPPSATKPMRDVAEFYKLVLGLRLAVCDARDVPFAGRWVARHTGVPEGSAYRVIEALKAGGVIVKTGSLPARGKNNRGTTLYAPGLIPGAPVSVERRAELVGDAPEPEAHLRDEALVSGAEAATVHAASLAAGCGAVDFHAAEGTTRRGGRAGRGDHHREGWRDA